MMIVMMIIVMMMMMMMMYFSPDVGKNVISLTNSAIRLQRHHPILSYALKKLKVSVYTDV